VSRDLRAVHAAAARRGLTVAFAADTHLHADFFPAHINSPRRVEPRYWRRRPATANSPTPGCTMTTRWTWAVFGCVRC
jgi:hypothetical protein